MKRIFCICSVLALCAMLDVKALTDAEIDELVPKTATISVLNQTLSELEDIDATDPLLVEMKDFWINNTDGQKKWTGAGNDRYCHPKFMKDFKADLHKIKARINELKQPKKANLLPFESETSNDVVRSSRDVAPASRDVAPAEEKLLSSTDNATTKGNLLEGSPSATTKGNLLEGSPSATTKGNLLEDNPSAATKGNLLEGSSSNTKAIDYVPSFTGTPTEIHVKLNESNSDITKGNFVISSCRDNENNLRYVIYNKTTRNVVTIFDSVSEYQNWYERNENNWVQAARNRGLPPKYSKVEIVDDFLSLSD